MWMPARISPSGDLLCPFTSIHHCWMRCFLNFIHVNMCVCVCVCVCARKSHVHDDLCMHALHSSLPVKMTRICVCVCVCLCVYPCTHVNTCSCVDFVYMHACMHICTFIHAYIHTYIQLTMHEYMQLRTISFLTHTLHICTYTHTNTHTNNYEWIHAAVCIHTYIHTYMQLCTISFITYILHVCTYTHTYTPNNNE